MAHPPFSRITESLHCSVTFFPANSVFQDLETGRTIGSGRAHGGLYLQDSDPSTSLGKLPSSQALQADGGSTLESLHQWHRRLGHPSFGVLEHLYPSLIDAC